MIRSFNSTGVRTVDALVIGAGHAGLAMSHCLSQRGVDHVVLERGSVAHTWRHERWDSLRLLTPNWQARLPGFAYDGDDPDGYLTMPEVIGFLERYAGRSQAPIHTDTAVSAVRLENGAYQVVTDRGDWWTRTLVVATGPFNLPVLPACASDLPDSILQLTAQDYRNPDSLPDGGVLVVGASATGLQLAEEINRSGRPVTLAVGEHVRLPRRYRGHDIQWWMHLTGVLDQGLDDVDDLRRARRVPSPQLIGTPEGRTLDLNALGEQGVRLAGRLAGVRDGRVQFSGSLRNVCELADLKMNRLLDAIDEWIARNDCADAGWPAQRFAATRVDSPTVLDFDLEREAIRTVVWATGFRPDYSWLDASVLDRKGLIRHDGGIADTPGLYVIGLPFLRRRKSSFIHGAEDDANDLSNHLRGYLDGAWPAGRPPMRQAV